MEHLHAQHLSCAHGYRAGRAQKIISLGCDTGTGYAPLASDDPSIQRRSLIQWMCLVLRAKWVSPQRCPDLSDICPDCRADFTMAALEIPRALRSLDSGGASGDSRRGMCILLLLTFQESLLAHCFVVMPFSSPISFPSVHASSAEEGHVIECLRPHRETVCQRGAHA